VLVVGVLVLAANLLVVAALSQDTDDPVAQQPTEIERLFPSPGAVIRPQDTIGVDLRDDLQAQLYLDGPDTTSAIALPVDQYVGDPNQGLVQFRPGPGREVRELEPGAYTLRVDYWPRGESIADAELGSFSWRFLVG
jgi:hypothetical protein